MASYDGTSFNSSKLASVEERRNLFAEDKNVINKLKYANITWHLSNL
jgi:hypothetical protein